MHDADEATTAPDDYQWPTCTHCRKPLWESEVDRHACRPCQDRAQQQLRDLASLYPRLDTPTALQPGATRPSSGPAPAKIHAPIPVRLDVLDLVAGGGITTRLAAIEDAWRAALGRRIAPWAGSPRQALPGHVDFLVINLDWACRVYGEIADDLEEIRRLHAAATAALDPKPRPGRVQIGTCPVATSDGRAVCGTALTASTARQAITCHGCGTRWTGFTAWRDLRAAQRAAARTAA